MIFQEALFAHRTSFEHFSRPCLFVEQIPFFQELINDYRTDAFFSKKKDEEKDDLILSFVKHVPFSRKPVYFLLEHIRLSFQEAILLHQTHTNFLGAFIFSSNKRINMNITGSLISSSNTHVFSRNPISSYR